MSDPVDPTQVAMVLEPCRLQALAEELGDSAPALRFLSTYLSMLPARVLKLSAGLGHHDSEASMDAVLSLKISSAMVGAVETAGQCQAMESMIRAHHLDAAAQAFPALQRSTEQCFAAGPQLLVAARKSLCPGSGSQAGLNG